MFTLSDVVESHIRKFLTNLYTCLPGFVVAVKELNGSTVVDVQTGVNRVTEDGRAEMDAVLEEVPIVWPSSGGCYITTPIEVGDTVLIYFGMRSTSEWKNSAGNEPQTPFLTLSHNVNDAFAMPSMLPYGKAPIVDSEAVKIASTGTEIRILKDGTIELGEGATEAIIKGNAFKTWIDAEFNKILAHTHPVQVSPATGTGATTGIVLSLTPMPETTLSEVSKTK